MTDRAHGLPMRTSTPWAWALALSPVVSGLAMEPALIGFQRAVATMVDGRATRGAADFLVVGFLVDAVVTLLLLPASGLLARLDQRGLQRAGVDRPFPWGWGFLFPVYLIGRTAVLQRRTGQGAAPLVLAGVLFAAVLLVLFVQFGLLFGAAIQHLPAHG